MYAFGVLIFFIWLTRSSGLSAPALLRKNYKVDWHGFTSSILLPGIAPDQPPFIRGRCLWAASYIAQKLSVEQVGY